MYQIKITGTIHSWGSYTGAIVGWGGSSARELVSEVNLYSTEWVCRNELSWLCDRRFL